MRSPSAVRPVVNGVLHCDTEARGPNGEPPVVVRGWDAAEGQP